MRIVLSNHARMRAQMREVSFEEIVECITDPDAISIEPEQYRFLMYNSLSPWNSEYNLAKAELTPAIEEVRKLKVELDGLKKQAQFSRIGPVSCISGIHCYPSLFINSSRLLSFISAALVLVSWALSLGRSLATIPPTASSVVFSSVSRPVRRSSWALVGAPA